jgi:hypothetical protein
LLLTEAAAVAPVFPGRLAFFLGHVFEALASRIGALCALLLALFAHGRPLFVRHIGEGFASLLACRTTFLGGSCGVLIRRRLLCQRRTCGKESRENRDSTCAFQPHNLSLQNSDHATKNAWRGIPVDRCPG